MSENIVPLEQLDSASPAQSLGQRKGCLTPVILGSCIGPLANGQAQELLTLAANAGVQD